LCPSHRTDPLKAAQYFDELPRNALSKVDRNMLQAMAARLELVRTTAS
jgi:hypothetical protein